MKNNGKRKYNEPALFDDTIGDFFKPLFWGNDTDAMRTDIKDLGDKCEMTVEMPGFDKNDITINLEDGYLSVCAKKDDVEKDGNYIKRERTVSCSRNYYVGDLSEELIKAKYENGILKLDFPKPQEKLPEKKRIAIE